MTIVLDDFFKFTYEKSGLNRGNAYLYCTKALERYDRGTLNDVFNVLKVGNMINTTYSDVNNRVFDVMPSVDGNKDYSALEQKREDVLALSLVYFQETQHPDIEQYVRAKRNIDFEVAANLYGDDVSTYYRYNHTLQDANVQHKVAEMKKAGLKDYNVEEEPNVSWDEHYFNIALQVSRNSKCFSRKIGAILVRDKRVISTGYNGPPEGVPTCDHRWLLDVNFSKKFGFADQFGWDHAEGKCPRQTIGFKSGKGIEWCPAVHAEENTILNCARMGIASKNTIMYMTCGVPCSKCMVKIINAGVSELVVTKFSYYDETSQYLLENSDVKVRLYDFTSIPIDL